MDMATLIAYYDAQGYDWDEDEREFIPRPDGPMATGLPLGVQAALEGMDPARYLDRGDELRGQ